METKCVKCTCLYPALSFREIIFIANNNGEIVHHSVAFELRCRKCGKLRGFMDSKKKNPYHNKVLECCGV